MSTSGITSSLLAQIADSPSAANQFVTDLNQLAQDLQSGNLSAAQQDYVTLTQDALNGATSSASTTSSSGITTSLLSNIASSSTSSTAFVNELNQLGTDLSNGDLASSESDMLSLDSTALNADSTASATSASSTSTAANSPANSGEITELVNATTQAMEDGDDSAISADMAQLASISASPAGASYLESESQNYGSGAPSSSASGSVNQLLQSLDANGSSSSGSLLNVLA